MDRVSTVPRAWALLYKQMQYVPSFHPIITDSDQNNSFPKAAVCFNSVNMMQKIVLKVHMTCDKCRSKALKHSAIACGVTSVAIEGEEKDRIVVIGDGVDSANLTRLLRKKVGYASIVSVENVGGQDEPGEEENDPTPIQGSSCYIQYPQYLQYPMYKVVYDPNPTGCPIM